MKSVTTMAGALALMALSGTAFADHHRYVGTHPLGNEPNDGFCFLQIPHVHTVAPSARLQVLYETRNNQHDFIGDPVPFGYDGQHYGYYGHHPVVVEFEGDSPFCYIEGPHFHEYRPAMTASYEFKGDLYWYTGALPTVYVRDQKHHKRVNLIYTPIVYTRPVVSVEPPSAYMAVYAGVGVGPGGVHAGVVVAPPPPPTLSLDVHIGGASPPPTVVRERTVLVVDDHPGKHKGHHKQKHGNGHGKKGRH